MVGVLPEKVRLRPTKYMPFPGRMIDVVEGKDELLERVDRYAQSKAAYGLIDLDHIRRQIEMFPSPEQVREEMRDGDNPKAAIAIVSVMHGLRAAEYVEQHSDTVAAVLE